MKTCQWPASPPSLARLPPAGPSCPDCPAAIAAPPADGGRVAIHKNAPMIARTLGATAPALLAVVQDPPEASGGAGAGGGPQLGQLPAATGLSQFAIECMALSFALCCWVVLVRAAIVWSCAELGLEHATSFLQGLGSLGAPLLSLPCRGASS